VTDSRYVPSSYSTEPRGFGRAEGLHWKTSNDVTELARIRASKLQHSYSVRIRKRMTDMSVSAKQFAAASGTSYERLLKVLRGDVIMRLEDIASADLVLGEVSEFAVQRALQQSRSASPRG
jgi:hypothetical protein